MTDLWNQTKAATFLSILSWLLTTCDKWWAIVGVNITPPGTTTPPFQQLTHSSCLSLASPHLTVDVLPANSSSNKSSHNNNNNSSSRSYAHAKRAPNWWRNSAANCLRALWHNSMTVCVRERERARAKVAAARFACVRLANAWGLRSLYTARCLHLLSNSGRVKYSKKRQRSRAFEQHSNTLPHTATAPLVA